LAFWKAPFTRRNSLPSLLALTFSQKVLVKEVSEEYDFRQRGRKKG
jgi:hypothetical protein